MFGIIFPKLRVRFRRNFGRATSSPRLTTFRDEPRSRAAAVRVYAAADSTPRASLRWLLLENYSSDRALVFHTRHLQAISHNTPTLITQPPPYITSNACAFLHTLKSKLSPRILSAAVLTASVRRVRRAASRGRTKKFSFFPNVRPKRGG